MGYSFIKNAKHSIRVIPKILHQTTSDKSKLHPELQANVQRLVALNPDWEYRLYDNEECRAFVAANYDRRTLQLYDRISARYGAARADFFRYLLLYRLGGVYLDIKSTVLRPLSSVISADTGYLFPAGIAILADARRGQGSIPSTALKMNSSSGSLFPSARIRFWRRSSNGSPATSSNTMRCTAV